MLTKSIEKIVHHAAADIAAGREPKPLDWNKISVLDLVKLIRAAGKAGLRLNVRSEGSGAKIHIVKSERDSDTSGKSLE